MAIPGVDDLLAVSISGKQTNMLVTFYWPVLIIQNKIFFFFASLEDRDKFTLDSKIECFKNCMTFLFFFSNITILYNHKQKKNGVKQCYRFLS